MAAAGDGPLPTARRWEASASARASQTQLAAGAAAIQAQGTAALDKEFSRIDADQDGVISRSEFLFDRIDRNHDGVISRSEFDAALAVPHGAGAPKEPVRSGSTSATGSTPWPARGSLQRSTTKDLDSSATGWQNLGDIEALEHSKTEHYVAQVTLSREQMALFSRELERLQHQVAQILGAGGPATSLRELAENVGYMELRMNDSLSQHTHMIEELRQCHEEWCVVHGSSPERLTRLERSMGDLQDKHVRLEQDLRGHLDSLPERMAALEQNCGRLLDQHSEELAQLRRLPDRLDCLARDLGDPLGRHDDILAELRRSYAMHEQALAEVKAAHESHAMAAMTQVAERLERETRDRQEALADLSAGTRVAISEVRSELCTGIQDLAELRRSHGEFREALDARHAPLVDRLASLEKHSSELRRSHGDFREALDARHAPLVDRLASLERDSSELRRGHGEFREALDAGHALLADRLAFLEKEIGASSDGHLSTCDRSFEVVRQSLDERVARLEQETLAEPQSLGGAVTAEVSMSLAARVANVERGLGDSATRHARYAEEQNKALYEYHSHHVTIEERVKCLEQACGDAANTWQNHAVDLRRLSEQVNSVNSQRHDSGTAAVKARLDALEQLHEQDTRSMDLLVDCLQKELRHKSELLDRIRKSNQLSLMKADRENTFGCVIDCSPPPTARPHPHHGLSPELARPAK